MEIAEFRMAGNAKNEKPGKDNISQRSAYK
jgi:hypothetical protein